MQNEQKMLHYLYVLQKKTGSRETQDVAGNKQRDFLVCFLGVFLNQRLKEFVVEEVVNHILNDYFIIILLTFLSQQSLLHVLNNA